MTEDLLILKYHDRQKLISIANPSYLKTKLGFSHSLISNSDAQIVDIMPDHIRKDLNITIFDPNLSTMFDLDERSAKKVMGRCCEGCMLTSVVGALTWAGSRTSLSERLMALGFTALWAIGLGGCYTCMKYNPACHQCCDKIRESKYSCKLEKQY